MIKYKKLFKESALNSTSHSIPKIIRTEIIIIKILWFILTLIGVGASAYVIVKAIMDFCKRDVVTKVRIIHEDFPLFPTVTICNLNPIVTKSGINIINSEMQFDNKTYEEILDEENSEVYYYYLAILNNIATNWTNDRKKELGYSYNDMIIKCDFMRYRTCEEKDFDWYYSPKYGNCYRFNSGYYNNKTEKELIVSTSPGSDYGLSLNLFVGVEEGYRTLDPGLFTSSHGKTIN